MKKTKKDLLSLGKNCVIEDGVEIGLMPKNTIKDARIIIGNNCLIRRGTMIYAGVRIGDNFQTGHNTLIREYNTIGNNVSIGSYTELGLRNSIGDNTRIHSQCFLEDVTLGKDIFVGPHVMFTNDPHPLCPTYRNCFKGATVGNGAIIGANATILPHVKIGKRSLIGAGSVVVHDVSPFSVVVGNPARKIKKISDIICVIGKVHKPYENYTSR